MKNFPRRWELHSHNICQPKARLTEHSPSDLRHWCTHPTTKLYSSWLQPFFLSLYSIAADLNEYLRRSLSLLASPSFSAGNCYTLINWTRTGAFAAGRKPKSALKNSSFAYIRPILTSSFRKKLKRGSKSTSLAEKIILIGILDINFFRVLFHEMWVSIP